VVFQRSSIDVRDPGCRAAAAELNSMASYYFESPVPDPAQNPYNNLLPLSTASVVPSGNGVPWPVHSASGNFTMCNANKRECASLYNTVDQTHVIQQNNRCAADNDKSSTDNRLNTGLNYRDCKPDKLGDVDQFIDDWNGGTTELPATVRKKHLSNNTMAGSNPDKSGPRPLGWTPCTEDRPDGVDWDIWQEVWKTSDEADLALCRGSWARNDQQG